METISKLLAHIWEAITGAVRALATQLKRDAIDWVVDQLAQRLEEWISRLAHHRDTRSSAAGTADPLQTLAVSTLHDVLVKIDAAILTFGESLTPEEALSAFTAALEGVDSAPELR